MSNTQPEPSMDDILASIRRIISEDGQTSTPMAEEGGDPGGIEVMQSGEQSAAVTSAKAESDVFNHSFDTTEPTPVSGNTERPQVARMRDTALPAEAAPTSEDVFEEITPEALMESSPQPQPTEAMFNVDSEQMPAASASRPGGIAGYETHVAAPEDAYSAGATAPDLASPDDQPKMHGSFVPSGSLLTSSMAPETVKSDQQTSTRPDSDGLLARASADAAVNAFDDLSENMRIATGDGRTLEDVVERLLEPMLKNWLDINLPRIVEEKVEDEVRRIARRR